MIESLVTKIGHIDLLTAFGLLAVSLMLLFYALEGRSHWFVFAFAGSCVMASVYGFAQGAWPFGLVEGVWAMVAMRRWVHACAREVPASPPMLGSVNGFLGELSTIAQSAGRGDYTFPMEDGTKHGAVQFIVQSPRRLIIHRLWTLHPGKGSGTRMLRTLCDLADRHDVELILKVIPIGRKPYPMDRDSLLAWYKKYGFEGNHRRMLRKPQSVVCPSN